MRYILTYWKGYHESGTKFWSILHIKREDGAQWAVRHWGKVRTAGQITIDEGFYLHQAHEMMVVKGRRGYDFTRNLAETEPLQFDAIHDHLISFFGQGITAIGKHVAQTAHSIGLGGIMSAKPIKFTKPSEPTPTKPIDRGELWGAWS